VNKEIELNDDISNEVNEVLKVLLEKDPKKRVKAKDLKKMAYFQGVDWDVMKKGEGHPPFIPKIENDLDLRYFEKRYVENEVVWNEGDEASSQNLYEYYLNFSYKNRMESVGEKGN